jgi:hypothetical protein
MDTAPTSCITLELDPVRSRRSAVALPLGSIYPIGPDRSFRFILVSLPKHG